jgi:hypothetical protein
MAEGLAVASGVVSNLSIVSLAGQVVQGLIALSNFFDDIRDAIRSLALELNTLTKTIDEMI